jgi:hypothetical protein
VIKSIVSNGGGELVHGNQSVYMEVDEASKVLPFDFKFGLQPSAEASLTESSPILRGLQMQNRPNHITLKRHKRHGMVRNSVEGDLGFGP